MIPNTVADPEGLHAMQRWVRMTTVFFVILGAVWALMDATHLAAPPPEVAIPLLLAIVAALGVQFNTLMVTRVALLAMIGAGVAFLSGFGFLTLLYAGIVLLVISVTHHQATGRRREGGPVGR